MNAKKLTLSAFLLFCLTMVAHGQVLNPNGSVLNPTDTIVEFGEGHFYNEDNLPALPPNGHIGKWIVDRQYSWSDPFKSYFYRGTPFRLMFPKGYDPNDTVRYPLILVLHGAGVKMTSYYDNGKQMRIGGKEHLDAANKGKWKGFLLYPHSFGGWPNNEFDRIKEIIEFMIEHRHVDPNRVVVHGRSMGGGSNWDIIMRHPKFYAAAAPMSGIPDNQELATQKHTLKTIPIWLFQGGKDKNPNPGAAQAVVDELHSVGADLRFSLYENRGHGVWPTSYNEADFFPFLTRANKANPWPLFEQTEFCPGVPINVTLTLTAGFNGYEWRKDGVLIAGANGHTLQVTEAGVYSARIRRGSEWSYWSPEPVSVGVKAPTQTPPISLAALHSNVIPAVDRPYTVLELPEGYETYAWYAEGSNVVLGTERTLQVSQPGRYVASVTEKFGCSSNLSAAFEVVSANGPSAPDAINGLTASAESKTSVRLQWSQNPSPAHEETLFEVYRGLGAEGALTYVGAAGANVLSFVDEGLLPGTAYRYVVRPVNETAAAAASEAVSATTLSDVTPPTAPLNLRAVQTSTTQIELAWDGAIDDVGVSYYEVYRDGVKARVVSDTTAVVYSVLPEGVYNFTVRAVDLAGNKSVNSNQVTAVAVTQGLTYRYYHTGSINTVNAIAGETLVKEGITETFSFNMRERNDRFGIIFEGVIQVPTTGNYRFFTRSDDGSRLYINGSQVVNNDGNHGCRERNGTVTLTAGAHDIEVRYYNGTGGRCFEVRWQGPGISKQLIPAEVLQDDFVLPGVPPLFPTGLTATAIDHERVGLSWTDASSNETGFQVFRATAPGGPYYPINTVAAGTTSYTDLGLADSTTYYYQVVALGEYGVSHDPADLSTPLGDINAGVGARDNATGTGYLMFSAQNVFSRFSSRRPHSSNSDHVVVVRYHNGNWQYDHNGGYRNFTPVATDVLLAFADFSADTVASLEGDTGVFQGIAKGYAAGDLTYLADWWNGGPNNGEFTVSGTYFVRHGVGGYASATTLPLPAAPAAPSGLVAEGSSATSVSLQFAGSGADRYAIERALVGDTLFLPLVELAATAADTSYAYTDEGLFQGVTYRYRVVGVGAGGGTPTGEVSAEPLNSAPVLSGVRDITLRYGTSQTIALSGTDPDSNTVSISAAGLPAFATLTSTGAGTATLTLSPVGASSQGTYGGTLIASDVYGGADSVSFQITVDDNFVPVIAPIGEVTILEGEQAVVALSGSDAGGEAVSWSYLRLPAFAVVEAGPSLRFAPDFGSAGVYPVGAVLTDARGSADTVTFLVSVEDVRTVSRVVRVNFSSGGLTGGSGWNNLAGTGSGSGLTNLQDTQGAGTGMGLSLLDGWSGSNTLGMNSSALYPAGVTRSAFWSHAGNSKRVRLTGLVAGERYDVVAFASRSGSGSRPTVYTVGGESGTLNVLGNTTGTSLFEGAVADGSGEITLTAAAGGGAAYYYLGALEVRTYAPDSGLPAPPVPLSATVSESGVSLSWTDRSINETGFVVYRGGATGSLSVLASLPSGVEAYVDATAEAQADYRYAVVAQNAHGESAGDTLSVATGNRAPEVSGVQSFYSVAMGDTLEAAVTLSDESGEAVSVGLVGAPGFVSYASTGVTTGVLRLLPTEAGRYEGIVLRAEDASGGVREVIFSVEVPDPAGYRVLVNFAGLGSVAAGGSWNNVQGDPEAGLGLTALVDETGSVTGLSVALLDGWDGSNELGSTGGIYPDAVTTTSFWESSPQARRVRIGGLTPGRSYSFKFFGSRAGGGNRSTRYRIGSESAVLNASYNTEGLAVLSGVVAGTDSAVVVYVSKEGGASYGYLNAMEVIQEALPGEEPPAPAESLMLRAAGRTSTVRLTWETSSNSSVSAYEVWRQAPGEAVLSLLDNISAATTEYLDTAVAAGALYYYQIIAQRGPKGPLMSGISATSLQMFSVSVNMNVDDPAAAPWNNFNAVPDKGLTLDGLATDQGAQLGLSITIVEENPVFPEFLYGFNGDNPMGTVTGDNSGVVPDAVLQSSYWLDPGITAELRIEGLDLSLGYNLEFYASRAGGGNRSTDYTVDGRSASLDASYNTTEATRLESLRADEQGGLTITVRASAGSLFGYLNGLKLEAYQVGSPAPAGGQGAGAATAAATDEVAVPANWEVYPNPVVSNGLRVRSGGVEAGELLFWQVRDLTGRVVRSGRQVWTDNGETGVDMVGVEAGVYVLELTTTGGQRHVARIIKQ